MDDHSWFSERTKTIMVTVTMVILVGGMLGGYYAAHMWRQERLEIKEIELQQRHQLDRLKENEPTEDTE